jgi:hypothetical protein
MKLGVGVQWEFWGALARRNHRKKPVGEVLILLNNSFNVIE